MTIDQRPMHVELTLDMPLQDGLLFPLHLNLQNRDELHLVVDSGFWLEWFPCTKPAVRDMYRDAVCGLIDGTYRILEKRTPKMFLRGYLQRFDGATWRTVGQSFHQYAWPGAGKETRILHNVSRGFPPEGPLVD